VLRRRTGAERKRNATTEQIVTAEFGDCYLDSGALGLARDEPGIHAVDTGLVHGIQDRRKAGLENVPYVVGAAVVLGGLTGQRHFVV